MRITVNPGEEYVISRGVAHRGGGTDGNRADPSIWASAPSGEPAMTVVAVIPTLSPDRQLEEGRSAASPPPAHSLSALRMVATETRQVGLRVRSCVEHVATLEASARLAFTSGLTNVSPVADGRRIRIGMCSKRNLGAGIPRGAGVDEPSCWPLLVVCSPAILLRHATNQAEPRRSLAFRIHS
jgi:hypothetical protein